MNRSMLVELYVGGKSPMAIRHALARAELRVRSVGISHVYIEVNAASDEEAIAIVRRVGDWSSDDVHVVTSYLDALPTRAAAIGEPPALASRVSSG